MATSPEKRALRGDTYSVVYCCHKMATVKRRGHGEPDSVQPQSSFGSNTTARTPPRQPPRRPDDGGGPANGELVGDKPRPRPKPGALTAPKDRSEWRCLVEVAAALSGPLPLPPLGAVALAAFGGPFDLGRGPLEAGPDLIGLDLGHRPLVTLRGLPGPLAEPPGDHDPVPLGERVGQVLGLPPPDIDPQERGVAVAPLAVLLDALGDGDPQVGDGDAGVGEAQLGGVDEVAGDGGLVVRCHLLLPISCCWLAFGAGPLAPVPGAGGLGAGGVDSVGGSVVLADLPDDRVGVVLAAVVDGHPDPECQGGFPVTDRLAAALAALVVGDAEVGVEPVEGLLGGALSRSVVAVVDPVAMVQLVWQVGVVVRPGPDLGMLDDQVGDGVVMLPVVGVELEGLGGQLLVV